MDYCEAKKNNLKEAKNLKGKPMVKTAKKQLCKSNDLLR